MELAIWVQILDEAVCISLQVNSFRKGRNTPVPSLAMGKIVAQTGFFSLGKKNFKFKLDLLHLKIDLVSHPTHGGGVG